MIKIQNTDKKFSQYELILRKYWCSLSSILFVAPRPTALENAEDLKCQYFPILISRSVNIYITPTCGIEYCKLLKQSL